MNSTAYQSWLAALGKRDFSYSQMAVIAAIALFWLWYCRHSAKRFQQLSGYLSLVGIIALMFVMQMMLGGVNV